MKIPKYTHTFSDETTITATHPAHETYSSSILLQMNMLPSALSEFQGVYQDSHYTVYGVNSHLSDLV
jgi:hypothetical protein